MEHQQSTPLSSDFLPVAKTVHQIGSLEVVSGDFREGELVVWNEGENVPGVDCGGAAAAAAQDDFGSKALFGANGGTDRTNETEA